MAANSHSRGLATFGKQFLSQIRTTTHSPNPPSLRRAVHVSVYDKNPDEQANPTVVPDEVIQPKSDKYWEPHPKTGVFGPASTDRNQIFHSSTANASEGGSVLEQKAFFRPLEDLEKPLPNP